MRASTDINALLSGREKIYGAFATHAEIAQRLKTVMGTTLGYGDLADDQREALEMIMHKIARILNGDPNYVDSWTDICGYAQLVANRLELPSVHNGNEKS